MIQFDSILTIIWAGSTTKLENTLVFCLICFSGEDGIITSSVSYKIMVKSIQKFPETTGNVRVVSRISQTNVGHPGVEV